jgi:glycosyltransferase involved in cell wall biosynthesis
MTDSRAPMQVDVVLLTKNSEHLLGKCLSSIYQNVPIKSLIVIDGFSTDRTLEILQKFNRKHGNVSAFQMNGSRAKARTEGIRRVRTDWFMFVDSDVLLCRDWFKKAQTDLTDGTGAVWGLNIDVLPNIKNRRILKLQSMIARQCFNLRGGMHDTLILRKAVEGIRVPEHLHTYEDTFIVQWVKTHGYKVTVGSNVYCLHYKPPNNWSLKNGFEQAIGEFKCGLVYSHLYRYSFFYPFFFLYWCVQLPLNGFRNGLTH